MFPMFHIYTPNRVCHLFCNYIILSSYNISSFLSTSHFIMPYHSSTNSLWWTFKWFLRLYQITQSYSTYPCTHIFMHQGHHFYRTDYRISNGTRNQQNGNLPGKNYTMLKQRMILASCEEWTESVSQKGCSICQHLRINILVCPLFSC